MMRLPHLTYFLPVVPTGQTGGQIRRNPELWDIGVATMKRIGVMRET
ncbi:MAG: hypothetical protein IIA61_13260 [Candidatus Marinimicrobia bacterium]|nr:hypothetical protein [Candidatus Neomarinimicrobiota bacterium]